MIKSDQLFPISRYVVNQGIAVVNQHFTRGARSLRSSFKLIIALTVTSVCLWLRVYNRNGFEPSKNYCKKPHHDCTKLLLAPHDSSRSRFPVPQKPPTSERRCWTQQITCVPRVSSSLSSIFPAAWSSRICTDSSLTPHTHTEAFLEGPKKLSSHGELFSVQKIFRLWDKDDIRRCCADGRRWVAEKMGRKRRWRSNATGKNYL